MSTPEGCIRNAIMKYLRLKQIKCWIYDSVGIYDPTIKKFRIRYGRTLGLPDIHGILPGGRFFAIEVKAPGKYPSENQRQQIQEIEAHGGIAFVARSIKDVEVKLIEAAIPRGGV